MIFTEEDKAAVRKFIEIKNKGYYVNSNVLQKVYNRVLEKNLNPTNCGSCLRARVTELEKALNKWEEQERKEAEIKAQEATKQEAPGNASSLHSNPLEMSTDTKAEEEKPVETKKRGRKPKKKEE